MDEKFTNHSPEQLKISIKIATGPDWKDYKTICFEAVKESPDAFPILTKILEEEIYKGEEKWREMLRNQNELVFLLKDKGGVKGITIAKDERETKEGLRLVYLVYISPSIRKRHSGET